MSPTRNDNIKKYKKSETKDIIHFSLPEIEAKFKSYANAEFEIIQC